MRSESPGTTLWPLFLSLLAAISLAAILSHAFMRMPFPYGDNFIEVFRTYSSPINENLSGYLGSPRVFFRPLESVWRYAIAYGFHQGVFGYNLFLCALLTLVVVTFMLVCKPQQWRDLVAFLVALAVLTGHHAMQGSWEFATAINAGVVLAAGTVSIGLIGRSGGIFQQVGIILLTGLCLLTKELGLVIAGTFVLAHLLGMPGVRRRTAAIICAIVLAYLFYRLAVILPLEDISAAKPGKASSWSQYSSNVAASFIMFWLGFPVDGSWSKWSVFLNLRWQWIQIGAGIATALLLVGAWCLAPTPAELAESDAPRFDRRWFVLFGAALLASCALGFFYARHRHSAAAVPLLSYCTYLSMRVLLWRLDVIAESTAEHGRALLVGATIAGLACSVLWPLRVATGFEFFRSLSGAIRQNWHNDVGIYWRKEELSRRPFLISIARSVDGVPWPRKHVPILRLLGNRIIYSVNR
jgi:hypothetical protein